jgi:uncharacterized membrane protein YjgN (DUF898 family)
MIGAFLVIGAAYFAVFLFLSAFIGAKTFNLALNSTRLGEDFALEAGLSPLMMAWLYFSNTFLVIVTLGLFSPWAHVRLTRYVAGQIAVTGPRSVDGFIDSAPRQAGAIGEEVASFFDFDFSL